MGNSCSGRTGADLPGADLAATGAPQRRGQQRGAGQGISQDAAEPTGRAEADPAATSTTQQQGQQQTSDNDVMLEILQLMKNRAKTHEKILEFMTNSLEFMTNSAKKDERIQTNSKKSAGDYFVTTGALWRKENITDVAADQSCADAVSRIQARIKEFPLIDCKPEDEESRNAEGGKLSIPLIDRKPEDEESRNADGGKLSTPDPKWCLDTMRREEFSGFQKDQNIFYTSVTNARNDNAPGQKSLAHSVPVDGISSVFWPPYLELLTGASGDDTQRFYAVHGRMRDETQYTDIENKGIKNVAQNLLALPPDHETNYDGSGAGNLIIIPIVDLEESVDYLKENRFYDLLVVGRSKSVYNWIYNGAVSGTANVFSESLDATVEDANETDIKIATKFLNYYAKAAAYIAVTSVKEKLPSDGEEATGTTLFEKTYKQMDLAKPTISDTSSRKTSSSAQQLTDAERKLKQQISTISTALKNIESDGIRVPAVRQAFDFENEKVLKVKLKQYFDDVNIDLKLYPSWGLLGFKSLANWLVFAEQPLIPAGLDPETVPVPSIEIGSSSNCSHASDLSSDEPNDASLGSMSRVNSSPHDTRLVPAQ